MSSKDDKSDKNIIDHLLLIAGLFDKDDLIEMSYCSYNTHK